jgi:hypothetical protein
MYTKILCFNILIFFYSFYNKAETCCQTIARVFGEENININALSIEDIAKLKLTFEYPKNNAITEIKYKIYKYVYDGKDRSKITIFEKQEKTFEKVQDFNINPDEDENILNLFKLTNNEIGLETDKINIKENEVWIEIDEFKKILNPEEQNIVIKEDRASLKTTISKSLNLDNIKPGQHGIYIIKIKLGDNSLKFIFIDYMVTLGGSSGYYYYEIKKIFVGQEKNFILSHQEYKIKRSKDGTQNELNFYL